MFNDVFICDNDTLAVLAKFLVGFFFSNKVNFQNYFANKLIKLFVFEAVLNNCILYNCRYKPYVLHQKFLMQGMSWLKIEGNRDVVRSCKNKRPAY